MCAFNVPPVSLPRELAQEIERQLTRQAETAQDLININKLREAMGLPTRDMTHLLGI